MFAAGDLDPSFGGDGIVQIGNSYAGRTGLDAVVLPDGKTFVVGVASGGTGATGQVAHLARYTTGGSLDTTFSGDGRMTFDFGDGGDAEAREVVVRSDGKIAVVGRAGTGPGTHASRLGMALLNSNGTFDTTFGGGDDGKVHVDVPGGDSDWVYSLSPASGNKLVAAVGFTSAGGDRFVAMRLNANGTPDTTFGGTGFVSLNPGPFTDHAHSAVVTADGGVLVGGMRYTTDNGSGSGQYETALVKLRADGNLDTTWGGGDAQVYGTFPKRFVHGPRPGPGR